MLGLWLPLALADILRAWCDVNKAKILRSWGLDALADKIEEAEMNSFLAGFGNRHLDDLDNAGNGNRPWSGKPLEGADNGGDCVGDDKENRDGNAPDGGTPPGTA